MLKNSQIRQFKTSKTIEKNTKAYSLTLLFDKSKIGHFFYIKVLKQLVI